MGQVNSLAIMTHLRTQYGTLTSEDYKLLYIQLTHKLDTANNHIFVIPVLAGLGPPVARK